MSDDIIFKSLMNGLEYFNLVDSGLKEQAEKKWEEQEALFSKLLKEQREICANEFNKPHRFDADLKSLTELNIINTNKILNAPSPMEGDKK